MNDYTTAAFILHKIHYIIFNVNRQLIIFFQCAKNCRKIIFEIDRK